MVKAPNFVVSKIRGQTCLLSKAMTCPRRQEKVFKMGGGGISVDGTKKEKKKADQKSPSRLTRSIPQAERKNQISEYLRRKKKSLVTQNIDKKMNGIIEAGVKELQAKNSEEAGNNVKTSIYIGTKGEIVKLQS